MLKHSQTPKDYQGVEINAITLGSLFKLQFGINPPPTHRTVMVERPLKDNQKCQKQEGSRKPHETTKHHQHQQQ